MSLDAERDAWNHAAMGAGGLDALVCRLPENVLLLTGYWPLSSFCFVLLPRDREAVLVAVDSEVAEIPAGAVREVLPFAWGVVSATDPYGAVERHLRYVINQAGLEHARIGYEGSFEAVAAGHMSAEQMVPAGVTQAMLARVAPGATLLDATTVLHQARARKTHQEVERLRLANKVAALGLAAFRTAYEPGRTEAFVAARVEATIMEQGIGYEGAKHARAWAQLMSGPGSARAYTPHPATSSRVIAPGDLAVLELATMVDGYWSDLTRTLVAGTTPTAQQADLYAAVVAAHATAMAGGRAGMTGGAIDALARGEIERRGFSAHFLHHTGHGLGFRYHEPYPFLHPANTAIVEDGMVSSIEPGLYVEGVGGLRLEDNVVFTSQGMDVLSHAPRALDGAMEGEPAATL